LLPVVIAVGISGSIAGNPGIAPGFVVGLAANTISAGFMGGMIGGYIAGYIALAIIKNVKVPDWARGLMSTLIVPFFASIISCLIMVYIIGTPI
ncbi:PTS fructose transporter subunit IIC, partial [Klebsiella pneumoniae]|nr:PTS fructose transporter subunit IIC [Klebsiella pneumoniae]